MSKTELVLVPTPGIGHLVPATELAKLIINRDHRISIVILIINLPNVSSANVTAYVDSQSRTADPSSLIFLTLPDLPSPPDPNLGNFSGNFMPLFKPLVKQAINDRVGSGSPKPAGFLLTMFSTAMMDVAEELGVPSYIFFTSGANMLNTMFHFESQAREKYCVDVGAESNDPEKELDVPGFRNRVPVKVIPDVFFDEGFSKTFADFAARFRQSKGILVNTFMELESYALQALLDQEGIPPVYPVGPIIELDNKSQSGSDSKTKKDDENDSIMQWLDEQPDSSVVFLCFGSKGSFGEDQVKEIANALDRSGHRFLWSLRRPPPEDSKVIFPSETFEDALPVGFLERTLHRGKIIGWAPQVSILGHRAIGGFVSHCGWNSTLESMWFGVPIATWPIYAEQQLNAFELVKEVGLAVEIKMDYKMGLKTKKGNFLVTAEETESGVRKLMSMDEQMRGKVREVSDKGKKGLEVGGSSYQWLGRFIAQILEY